MMAAIQPICCSSIWRLLLLQDRKASKQLGRPRHLRPAGGGQQMTTEEYQISHRVRSPNARTVRLTVAAFSKACGMSSVHTTPDAVKSRLALPWRLTDEAVLDQS